jgi:hypothetical protein
MWNVAVKAMTPEAKEVFIKVQFVFINRVLQLCHIVERTVDNGFSRFHFNRFPCCGKAFRLAEKMMVFSQTQGSHSYNISTGRVYSLNQYIATSW